MASFVPILPKLSKEEQRVNNLFSEIQSFAIQRGFSAQEVKGKDLRCLLIAGQPIFLENTGPFKEAVRIVIDKDGDFKFQVFLKTLFEGHVNDQSFSTVTYLDQMTERSDFSVCPGIKQGYLEVKDSLKKKPQKLRTWAGDYRVDSTECKLWYNPTCNAKQFGLYACEPCQTLLRSMRQSRQRSRKRATLPKKTPPKSTPFAKMTPKKKGRVFRKRQRQIAKLQKKVDSMNKYECFLNEDQSEQMKNIMETVEKNFSDDLNNVLKESETHSDFLQEMWQKDLVKSKAQFTMDQLRNETGSSGNRFSVISYRIALAIFSRSKAAYEALKTFNILSLPSVSSLKQYMRASVEDPGPMHDRMKEERENYANLCDVKVKAKLPPPLWEGALIFDEVKVTANVYWNAKANKFMGHTLSHEDISTLHDVYQQLDTESKTKKASYVLQFLWRDIVSNVDIIGPYYTSEDGLDHKFIMSCVMETMHLFYIFDLDTVLLICDGASANLKLLKLLCRGESGVFPIRENEGINRYKVPTSFRNIYSTSDVHVFICPSHQLKNLIAALYSSQSNGSNSFEFDGTKFGWHAIIDMFNREKLRAENGEVRRVPDLVSNYVFRDKWTRLNVKASKIMQQEHVIAEINEFIAINNPRSRSSLNLTVQFLKACNKMFEHGLLSHTPIKNLDSPILKNLNDGFHFFMGWCDDSVLNNINLSSSETK